MSDETVASAIPCGACGAANDPRAPACRACGAALAAPDTHAVIVSVDFRPGTVFHGRYEILGPLGKGGMGMVYRARDRTLDEVVAIKILRPDLTQDASMAQRFKGEIKMARRIRHRNVCAIHDFGESQGLLYISMELVEGVDLKHILRERGALDSARAYDVAIQIAEGLQAVHEAGIVHRDLKTPNVMLGRDGVARLMDFGVAKRLTDHTLTATGHIVGTPEYMSPEQAQGRKVDYRSDVYALGIVIYEIFTGQVPFRGETPISTILKHIHDAPPLDPPEGARLPPELRGVLRRCLAKEPEERYDTARDVANALKDARDPVRRQQPASTEVLQAPTLPRPQKVAGTRRPIVRPMHAWLLVIPLAVGLGVFSMTMRSERPPAATPVEAGVPATIAAAPPATVPAPATTLVAEAVPTTTPPAAFRPADARVVAAPSPATPGPATPARPSPRPSPSARATAPPPTAAAAPVTTVAAAPAPTTLPVPGWLQVNVRPWGEVTVDGRTIGQTPLDRITLSPGPHRLRVRHPSFPVHEQTVVVRPGETEKVTVVLTASPAS